MPESHVNRKATYKKMSLCGPKITSIKFIAEKLEKPEDNTLNLLKLS